MTSRLHKLYAKVATHHSKGYRQIHLGALPVPVREAIYNKNLKAYYWVLEVMESVRRLDE